MEVRGGARDGEWCPDSLMNISDKFPGRSGDWHACYRRVDGILNRPIMQFVGYFKGSCPPMRATALQKSA